MKKKLLVVLLTVCMTVSLVACGNSDKKESSSGTVTEDITSEEKDNLVDSGVTEEEKAETQEQDNSDEQQNTNHELTAESDYANLPTSEGFVFESNGDGTCTLTELGVCSDADIVIPEKSPEGDMVTKIAEYAFYDAEDLTSIVFSGLTMELDKKAFQSCEVERVVITGCDLIIGENAFSYSEDIAEVYISNSNLEVGTYAFYDCGKDMKVTMNNCTGIVDEKAFQSCAIANLEIKDSTLELDENSFSYCEDLATVLFTNSTLEVGTYAFYDTGDDMTVTIEKGTVEMDDKAFQSCAIVSLNVSGTELVMGENTFFYCEDLSDVMIGANNTEIGTYSFYDCTSLTNVSIAAGSEDDGIKLIIDDKAFQNCAVQNVVIGRGDIEIGDNAFSYFEDLLSVDIKGTLSDIGDYAFYDCPAELAITYNGASYNKESIENVK